MATIKDIANELHLSISTVSKGLSGASDVSDKTRQLILDTAMKMGYVPKQNRAGAGLKKICVFIENMGYERIEQFGYDIIVGFKLEATAKKWDVSIVPLAMNQESEYNYDNYMKANHYAAGFLLGFTLHNDFIAQMRKTEIPTVLLDNVVYNKNVACVGVDNQQGIYYAVEHLARLGHKNIAMLITGKLLAVFHRRDWLVFGLEWKNAACTCGRNWWHTGIIWLTARASLSAILLRKALRQSFVQVICWRTVSFVNCIEWVCAFRKMLVLQDLMIFRLLLTQHRR
ncbi:LacI family DNA-binding transcriptional regulator [Thermocaproicibacter melissae]|nr:LacI family DNA-binding transcriptional regulator [Thermocaproicibacter melissae]WBY64686.1 LacI family DNA-binding transcriptional regulator [Thermocaproicibacter melissae]